MSPSTVKRWFGRVPIARWSTGEVAWHRWEQQVGAEFRVLLVGGAVLDIQAGLYQHHRNHSIVSEYQRSMVQDAQR